MRPDRGALFCAVTYFGDEPLDAADDCDHDASPGYEEAIRRALAERYPALAGAAWQRAWAGPYDYSPDWNPIIGEAPGVEGLHLALAWSGHGFKLSPAVGEVVAAEVLGDEPRIDVTALRPDALRRGQAPAPRLRARRARLTRSMPEIAHLQHVLPPVRESRGRVRAWSLRRAKGSTASAPSGARAGCGSDGDGGCSGWSCRVALLAGLAGCSGRARRQAVRPCRQAAAPTRRMPVRPLPGPTSSLARPARGAPRWPTASRTAIPRAAWSR